MPLIVLMGLLGLVEVERASLDMRQTLLVKDQRIGETIVPMLICNDIVDSPTQR